MSRIYFETKGRSQTSDWIYILQSSHSSWDHINDGLLRFNLVNIVYDNFRVVTRD